MRRAFRPIALPMTFALSWGLFGCPVGHQSPPARAQEAATELNVNTRFGRMEIAAEKVAPAERDAFLRRRKSWGAAIRVADYELAGMQMKGNEDAELYVKVAWYRVDQNDLHLTLLKQKWHDFKGDWKLVDESRAEGDVGLIGEPQVPAVLDGLRSGLRDDERSPPPKGRAAHFPTIRLGEGVPTNTPGERAPATIPPVDPNDESTR